MSQILEGWSNRDPDIPAGVSSHQTRELGPKRRGKEAKEIHKQWERQQRDQLNLAYDNLRVQLPGVASTGKASKQQVLNQAMETSHAIQSKEVALKTQMSTLAKTNSLLREKLEEL